MPPARLRSTVQARHLLPRAVTDRMFVLLAEHFEGTERATFDRDLAEKQWVVLLHDPDGTLVGFSTLMTLETHVEDRPIRAFFSGDTIVHRHYWGDPALAVVWGNFVLDQAARHPESKTYWFLISKGFRTYRFLPLYFKQFYPRHDTPTPPLLQAILDHLATLKFPGQYDPKSGLIRLEGPQDRLREELAEIPAGRLNDPHVAFFLERNPRYTEGDELACLAEIHPDNLTAAAVRICRMQARSAAD